MFIHIHAVPPEAIVGVVSPEGNLQVVVSHPTWMLGTYSSLCKTGTCLKLLATSLC